MFRCAVVGGWSFGSRQHHRCPLRRGRRFPHERRRRTRWPTTTGPSAGSRRGRGNTTTALGWPIVFRRLRPLAHAVSLRRRPLRLRGHRGTEVGRTGDWPGGSACSPAPAMPLKAADAARAAGRFDGDTFVGITRPGLGPRGSLKLTANAQGRATSLASPGGTATLFAWAGWWRLSSSFERDGRWS